MENILDIFKAEQPDAYQTFQELLSDEDITKSLEQGHIKSDAVEKALKDNLEKGGDKDLDILKAKLVEKEEEIEGLKEELEKKKVTKSTSDSEDIQKAISEGIEKAMSEKTGDDVFQKSLDSLSETVQELSSKIEEIGGVPGTPKSVQGFNLIQKGNKIEDEEGKQVLNIDIQKSAVIEVLQKSMDKAEGSLKATIQEDILNYSTAGMVPSVETTKFVNSEMNVRLVK